MQISNNMKSYTQFQTKATRGESLQPSEQQDQVSISGDQRSHGDFDMMGQALGGMIFGGVGAVGGAIAGVVAGSQLGAPILGTVGGIAIGGICGAVYGWNAN